MVSYRRGYFVTAKHAGQCDGNCGHSIFRGETILYLPVERHVYCSTCGTKMKAGLLLGAERCR